MKISLVFLLLILTKNSYAQNLVYINNDTFELATGKVFSFIEDKFGSIKIQHFNINTKQDTFKYYIPQNTTKQITGSIYTINATDILHFIEEKNLNDIGALSNSEQKHNLVFSKVKSTETNKEPCYIVVTYLLRNEESYYLRISTHDNAEGFWGVLYFELTRDMIIKRFCYQDYML